MGEIWNCPEIKKNGRLGQNQKGVDIYGIPAGENGYYGIQCKGKDDYSSATLTLSEIIQEVEKAKSFKPALKKLYFATTANKDEKIEETMRELNVAQIKQSLFEVHLYAWEDIVDLIDQNKRTHDWYLENQKYFNKSSIQVLFENGEQKIEASVQFKKIK